MFKVGDLVSYWEIPSTENSFLKSLGIIVKQIGINVLVYWIISPYSILKIWKSNTKILRHSPEYLRKVGNK